jgi:molybdenum cofactor cytidylyltransferase
MHASPVIIVVAVGGASRFLEPEAQGAASPLGATLAQAMGSGLPVVVVTTEALAGEASRHLASRDVLVLKPGLDSAGPGRVERRGLNAIQGVGIAMALGVAARPNAPGWLVLPGDMSRVQASTLRQVAVALREHPIAYAQHHGRAGHPVGFGAGLYSELVSLHDDEGARRLVARYPSHAVDVEDAGSQVGLEPVDELHDARAAWPGPAALRGRRLADLHARGVSGR